MYIKLRYVCVCMCVHVCVNGTSKGRSKDNLKRSCNAWLDFVAKDFVAQQSALCKILIEKSRRDCLAAFNMLSYKSLKIFHHNCDPLKDK